AFALIDNRTTDELLREAVAVISRRVDQRHAERDAGAYRFFFDRLRMLSLREMPGALAERWNSGTVWKPYGTRCGGLPGPVCRGKAPCTSGYREQRQAEGRAALAELTSAEQMLFHSAHGVPSWPLENCIRLDGGCRRPLPLSYCS